MPVSGFVTADDVIEGKPKPTPYLEGARKLGIDVTKCESDDTGFFMTPDLSQVLSSRMHRPGCKQEIVPVQRRLQFVPPTNARTLRTVWRK